MTYAEAVPWLYEQQWHGIKLGLENIRRLLTVLQVPLDSGAPPRYLHVAGTNGKGSVCALLDSILRAAGYRTGLYTSPHLVSFRERIRIDGAMISEEAAAAGLTEIRHAMEGWDPQPTFFEIATALALAHFAREKVEIAVVETGLGGRLDATNVVSPLVSVITPIDLDHQPWLGEHLAEIALEKGGIIKPGIPVVSAQQPDDAFGILTHLATHRDAPFHVVVSPLENVKIGLAGSHQRWNAALAVHALDVAGIEIPGKARARGIETVQWPGRFQLIEGHIVLDGAHNPAAARRLTQTWREVFGKTPASLVFGVMRDKDVRGICEALAPIAARVLTVPVHNERAMPPEELRDLFALIAPGLSCRVAPSALEAIAAARAHGERTLVTGSLFLVGEVLEKYTGHGDGQRSTQ